MMCALYVDPLTPRSDLHTISPFNSFVLQHTGDKNTQTYRIEVFILIQNQILVSNLQRNVKQLEERINNLIM